MKWDHLAVDSHYKTAVAVERAVARGDYADARLGLEELIEALSRSDRRALESHLICLMSHVVKWISQPERRSRSWRATIRNARRQIAKIQGETPSLNREAVVAMWNECYEAAKDAAESEMDREALVDAVSWEQVFVDPYDLSGDSDRSSK